MSPPTWSPSDRLDLSDKLATAALAILASDTSPPASAADPPYDVLVFSKTAGSGTLHPRRHPDDPGTGRRQRLHGDRHRGLGPVHCRQPGPVRDRGVPSSWTRPMSWTATWCPAGAGRTSRVVTRIHAGAGEGGRPGLTAARGFWNARGSRSEISVRPASRAPGARHPGLIRGCRANEKAPIENEAFKARLTTVTQSGEAPRQRRRAPAITGRRPRDGDAFESEVVQDIAACCRAVGTTHTPVTTDH